MTFDRDLFLEICKEYEVRFSKDYTAVMLEDNGCIKELCGDDIERIMFPTKKEGTMFYDDAVGTNSFLSSKDKTFEQIYFSADAFLMAA